MVLVVEVLSLSFKIAGGPQNAIFPFCKALRISHELLQQKLVRAHKTLRIMNKRTSFLVFKLNLMVCLTMNRLVLLEGWMMPPSPHP